MSPKFHGQPLIPDFDMMVAFGTTGNANGMQEYLGYSIPGTKQSEAGWQIFKLIYNSSKQVTERRYANGNSKLDKVWTSRTDYSYTP